MSTFLETIDNVGMSLCLWWNILLDVWRHLVYNCKVAMSFGIIIYIRLELMQLSVIKNLSICAYQLPKKYFA